MKRIRVIPALLMEQGRLVKTHRFGERTYVGDPVNTVKIFNDKEVDEVLLLDIGATPKGAGPNFELLREIASECFVPLSYGGGIATVEDARRIFDAGVEKIVLNTALVDAPELVGEVAKIYGSQAVIGSIDVRRDGVFRRERVYTAGGHRKTGLQAVTAAQRAVELGVGELLITSMDRDGTLGGYDVELIGRVSKAVPVPVIACGGASGLEDFLAAVQEGGASAVAAGALFVFKGPHRAVLVNYPSQQSLREYLFDRLGP